MNRRKPCSHKELEIVQHRDSISPSVVCYKCRESWDDPRMVVAFLYKQYKGRLIIDGKIIDKK